MKIAIDFEHKDPLYHFKAMVVDRVDGKNKYLPISGCAGISRKEVLKKGMKAVIKFLSKNDG